MLLTLAAVLFFFYKFMPSSIDALRGLTNVSRFDDRIVARYTESMLEDKVAADSMKALLYSVNRLAWFDTHYGKRYSSGTAVNIGEELNKDYTVTSSSGTTSVGSLNSYRRSYGSTGVTPTIMDMAVIYYTGEKKEISRQIAKNILECFAMYKDNAENNVRCFAGDFSYIGDAEVTEADIKAGFEDLKKDKAMCDNECIKILNEVTETNIIKWTPNWAFSLQGGKITKQNSVNNALPVRICAEDGSGGKYDFGGSWSDFWNQDKIYITTNIDLCKTPTDAMQLGFFIKDFNLPDYERSGSFSVAGAVQWLTNSYGDPKYVTYYEKFPEGEDAAWASSGMDNLFTFAGSVLGCRILGKFVYKIMGKNPIGLGVAKFLEVTKADRYVCTFFGVVVTRVKQAVDNPNFIAAMATAVEETLDSLTESLIGFIKEIKFLFTGENIESFKKSKHPEDVRNYLVVKYGVNEFIAGYYTKIVSEISDGTTNYEEYEEIYISVFKDTIEEYMGYKVNPDFTITNPNVLKNDKLDTVFENELLKRFKDKTKQDKLSETVVNRIKIFCENNLRDYFWIQRAAEETNDEIMSIYLDNDEDRTAKIKSIILENKKTEQLSTRDKKELYRKIYIAEKMAIEEQKINSLIYSSLGYTTSSTPSEIELNTAIEKLASGVLLEEFTQNAKEKSSPEISDLRAILVKEIALYKLRKNSETDKFGFLGTNAFGIKMPYKSVVPLSDKFTKNWVWPDDKDLYLDYFGHYGGYSEEKDADKDSYSSERYFGVVPEVNRYFISLRRDQVGFLNGFFSQPNTRFHLVSPCKANLLIRVTNCECYGQASEDTIFRNVPDSLKEVFGYPVLYETGEYNDYYKTNVKNFDGVNPMLFMIDKNTGELIKECPGKNFGNYLPWNANPNYMPLCIEVNPILDADTDPNYCYRGYEPVVFQGAHFLAVWGAPIAGAVIGATGDTAAAGTTLGAATLSGFTTGATIGGLIDFFIVDAIEAGCFRWPKHGGNAGFCK
ncbi:MAG: hypothetical protein V1859_06065 [archaeon]